MASNHPVHDIVVHHRDRQLGLRQPLDQQDGDEFHQLLLSTIDVVVHHFTVGNDVPGVVVEGGVLVPVRPFRQFTGFGALQSHIFLDHPDRDVAGQAGHGIDHPLRGIERVIRLLRHQRPNAWNVRPIQERRGRRLVPKMHRGVVLRHEIRVHFRVVRFVGEDLVDPQNLDYVVEVGDERADRSLQDRALFPQFVDKWQSLGVEPSTRQGELIGFLCGVEAF